MGTQREEAAARFRGWGYGMFIHYGLYSLHARGEWVWFKERMPKEEYFRVQSQFAPGKGCAREWVRMAKQSGMRYAVLTTQHHEGFFLGEKLVSEFCNACREMNIGVGLYYSVMDWSDDDFKKGPRAPEWSNFVARTHRRILELATDYGRIDYLFYDGCPPVELWAPATLHKKLRALQPELLISCRCGLEEDVSSSEQHTRAFPNKTWESCYTLNDTWGYNQYDQNWKSPESVIDLLTVLRHNGGNLLLNVGPQPDGTLQTKESEILGVVGQWLQKNGDGVYDVTPYPFRYMDQEISTARGNTVYIRLVNDYLGPKRWVCGIENRVKAVFLQESGEPVTFVQNNDRIQLIGLQKKSPGALPRMLRLELEGEPIGVPNLLHPDLSIRIT